MSSTFTENDKNNGESPRLTGNHFSCADRSYNDSPRTHSSARQRQR